MRSSRKPHFSIDFEMAYILVQVELQQILNMIGGKAVEEEQKKKKMEEKNKELMEEINRLKSTLDKYRKGIYNRCCAPKYECDDDMLSTTDSM